MPSQILLNLKELEKTVNKKIAIYLTAPEELSESRIELIRTKNKVKTEILRFISPKNICNINRPNAEKFSKLKAKSVSIFIIEMPTASVMKTSITLTI